MGSRNPKIAELGEKMSHGNKEGNEPGMYEEVTYTWKRKISNAIFEPSIPKEMLQNFDQLPFGFTAPNKVTSTKNGANGANGAYR